VIISTVTNLKSDKIKKKASGGLRRLSLAKFSVSNISLVVSLGASAWKNFARN
jgi:hypothetical protein